MEIRRFYADTAAEAQKAARHELGDDAVILDTVEDESGVEVFATLEESAGNPVDGHPDAIPTTAAPLIDEARPTLQRELAAITGFRQRLDEIVNRADAIPEEIQTDLFLLRKSLRKELIELRNYREEKAAEHRTPDPVTTRLQENLDALTDTLNQEISSLQHYQQQREEKDAALDPVTENLQGDLARMQESLALELTKLAEYRQRRETIDMELDPRTSKRWSELNEVQTALSSELSQLCEYRLQRAQMDAERDPITDSLQQELRDLQHSLSAEVESLANWREDRIRGDQETRSSAKTVNNELIQIQQSLANELETLGQYHAHRLKVDAESQPAFDALKTTLARINGEMEAELESARTLRETQTDVSTRVVGVTDDMAQRVQTLDREVRGLSETLSAEIASLTAWRQERESVASEIEPQQREAVEHLDIIREAMAKELCEMTSYRRQREETDARLDPITTGLHTELTRLQAELRGELVRLRQDTAARKENQAEFLEELSLIRQNRHEMQEERARFRAAIADELAALRSARTETLSGEPRPLEQRQFAPQPEKVESLGLSRDITSTIREALPENAGWRTVLDALGKLLTTGDDEIVQDGGVIAVLGSTGVGKTTTVAKLASRYAERHGKGKVALISTDTLRIGGADQLDAFARQLDMPLSHASNAGELAELIDALSDYELVLIDTAGINQRDVRLADHLNTLSRAAAPIRSYLALSATAEASLTREVVDAFGQIPLAGVVLTKVDEATTMGPVLSGVIRSEKPVSYLCNGQQVPHDMLVGNKPEILKLCRTMVLQASSGCLNEQQSGG